MFLLIHLTPKIYDDTVSADSAPTRGSKEPIKIETLNSIGSRYRHAEVTKLVSFDLKLKCLSMLGLNSRKRYSRFSKLGRKSGGTPLMVLGLKWYAPSRWQSCKSSQKPLVVAAIFSGGSENHSVVLPLW